MEPMMLPASERADLLILSATTHLRARLPGVIAAENDVRRRHQVKKDAEKAMRNLDTLIAALEKKKAEDERDAKAQGDAGSPATEPRESTK